MSDWTEGYVTEVAYTHGYYGELNPLRSSLALIHSGFAPVSISTACELGFGQGVSVNMHAAAGKVQWWGTDFNPSQTANARYLASLSGAPVRLSDHDFASFCADQDLPDFDFIALHGIWSWISDQNRDVIADFIRRKLKVGGLVYVSYNTMPGWAPFVPIRDLMSEFVGSERTQGQTLPQRIETSLAFLDRLLAVEPRYIKHNPQVAERIAALKGQSRQYLAHEYFNGDWRPMPFTQMAQVMRQAKMSYACSASYLDQLDILNLSQEQKGFIESIEDSALRELIRDLIGNQMFRRDYWVKGGRRLGHRERQEALLDLRVVMGVPRQLVKSKVKSPVGEITLKDEIYAPILDCLADYKPWSLREVLSELSPRLGSSQLHQAVMVLCGLGVLTMANPSAFEADVITQCQSLNRQILQSAAGSFQLGYLASPVTGGAVGVSRLHQLFLHLQPTDTSSPMQLEDAVIAVLNAEGEVVRRDGKPVTSRDEARSIVGANVREFNDYYRPLYERLLLAQDVRQGRTSRAALGASRRI